MTELLGRTIKKRYRVDKSLGRGGMAEVYKVWDMDRSAALAMKVLHEDLALDNAFVRRFQREAQTLRALQHPHIVRFYELEQEGRLAFILMDYVEGESLKHKIFDAHGPMPLDQVSAVMRPLCQALEYAHKQGFTHSDIKPGNVMLDKSGHVMLMDFGISRMTESATMTLLGAGTPAYMSPEQAKGKPPTPQSDIYAVGIILYEMLTGERPFTGEMATSGGSTGEKIRWEQLNLNPTPPRRFNKQVSNELEAVVMRCLEKDMRKRFSSAMELLIDLENVLPVLLGTKPIDSSILPRAESVTPVSQTLVTPGIKLKFPNEDLVRPASTPREEVKHLQPKANHPAPKKMQISPLIWLIGGVGVVLLGLVLGRGFISSTLPTPTLTLTPTLSPPTSTFTPSATNTPAASPTPTLDIGSTMIGEDGATLVYVPEGEFTMGKDADDALAECQKIDDCKIDWFVDQDPPHAIYLDAFWIDQTEVTNAMYIKCVDAGACEPPTRINSPKRSNYYGNPDFNNYPVIYVNWGMANTYCVWAKRKLPTESEWEKSARSIDERAYPWGNEPPNSEMLNYFDIVGDTTEVGKYPRGVSVYGALDVAGNVLEWVSDWYSDTYYQNSPSSNPLGPDSGQDRVLRGGSWYYNDLIALSAFRASDKPTTVDANYGFRCARDISK